MLGFNAPANGAASPSFIKSLLFISSLHFLVHPSRLGGSYTGSVWSNLLKSRLFDKKGCSGAFSKCDPKLKSRHFQWLFLLKRNLPGASSVILESPDPDPFRTILLAPKFLVKKWEKRTVVRFRRVCPRRAQGRAFVNRGAQHRDTRSVFHEACMADTAGLGYPRCIRQSRRGEIERGLPAWQLRPSIGMPGQ